VTGTHEVAVKASRTIPIELPDVARSNARRAVKLFARAPSESVTAQSGSGATRLRLSGPIGEGGITAAAVLEQLKDVTGNLVITLHSPGGDPFEAALILNDLVAHKGSIRVEIPSLAASAATIIMLAGDEIAIAESAHAMIHNVWGLTVGNKHDHRAAADVMESLDHSLILNYAKRTGLDHKSISKMMDDETWMIGAEAVKLGFADEILELGSDPAARNVFDLSIYSNVPDGIATAEPRDNVHYASRVDLQKALRDKLHLANGAARKIADAAWPVLASADDIEINETADRFAAMTAELRNMRGSNQ
jgi:ATP-dependent Clp protease protease subunit